MAKTKEYGSADFRAELVKIMPGYDWTVHKSPKHFISGEYFEATGTQSSGMNRLSTLSVIRRAMNGVTPSYEVKSAGFGTRAKWLHKITDGTLARALRSLQEHYEWHASNYRIHANALEGARKAKGL